MSCDGERKVRKKADDEGLSYKSNQLDDSSSSSSDDSSENRKVEKMQTHSAQNPQSSSRPGEKDSRGSRECRNGVKYKVFRGFDYGDDSAHPLCPDGSQSLGIIYAMVFLTAVLMILTLLMRSVIKNSSPLRNEQFEVYDDSLEAIERFLLQCSGIVDDVYAAIEYQRERQESQAFSVALLTSRTAADLDVLWSKVPNCNSEFPPGRCGRVSRKIVTLSYPLPSGYIQAALVSNIMSCGSLGSCIIEIRGCEILSAADLAPLLAALDRQGMLIDMGKEVDTTKVIFLLVFNEANSDGSVKFEENTADGMGRAYFRERLLVNMEKNKESSSVQKGENLVAIKAMLRRITYITTC